jgi:hypothetical protein
MKLENIEKVSTAYREYKHLQSVKEQVVNSTRLRVDLTTWTASSERTSELKIDATIPIDRYQLVSIIQAQILSKEIELYNLGVEDFSFDKNTTGVKR